MQDKLIGKTKWRNQRRLVARELPPSKDHPTTGYATHVQTPEGYFCGEYFDDKDRALDNLVKLAQELHLDDITFI